MNRIILIRHGETDMNTKGCFIGDTDAELSNDIVNLMAIEKLAISLKLPITAIISSPAKRAQQTAEIINRYINNNIIIEKDLREISFGSWETKTSDEVNSTDLAKWRMRNPDPNTRPTNGETLKNIADRVENILNQLCIKHENQTIIIVTHVYVIKAALDRAMNMPDGFHSNRVWLDTASTTIIDWSINPDKRIIHRINWTPDICRGMEKWTKS